MDIRTIRALARILQDSGLTLLEVTEGDTHIKLERASLSPGLGQPAPSGDRSSPANKDSGLDFNDITLVEAPIVGVFYSAPGPDLKPFVDIGSKVKKGDVLCIIEAMKLLNEITAECDGEVVDICVSDGDVVEFGQVLFKIF